MAVGHYQFEAIHPFIDGNKRTAFVVYRLFLKWNGVELLADKTQRYVTMLALAASDITEAAYADWLRNHTTPLTKP